MKEKKYKDDWVTEVSLRENGREKRTPLYQGAWFPLSAKRKREMLLRQTIGLALSLACWALYLALDFPGTRVLYVFLPLACGVFPLAYWAFGLGSLLRAPERMTRLRKEKSLGRIRHSAVGAAAFFAMALIGDLIFLFRVENTLSEIPGTALLLCGAITGIIFARGLDLEGEKVMGGKGPGPQGKR